MGQTRLWCWCLVLASLLAVPCEAAPRVGPLEVRAGHAGVACFTIPEAQERGSGPPQFDSISVADVFAPRTPLWSMTMPPDRTFAVSFRMCIPYGGRLPVLPHNVAAPLTAGRIYEVTMTPRAPEAGAPRMYRARFCLHGRAVQQLSVGAMSGCPGG